MKSRKVWVIIATLILIFAIAMDIVDQIQSHNGFHFRLIYVAGPIAITAAWVSLMKNLN